MSETETPTKQLKLFEGKRYPNVDVKLAGGVAGDAEFVIPEITGLKVGEAFRLVVSGYIAAKKHALSYDKEDEEVRTLVVTLKVDRVVEETTL
jgi:hypothetical protein